MPVIIKGKNIDRIDKLGKPGNIIFGIDGKNAENPKMVMGHNLTPPGFRGRRHYHSNCNVGQYIISGHRRLSIGPEFEKQEFDIEAGDFVLIYQGEIHSMQNLSETEPSELVFCYVGVNSKEEAKTVFVEPPLT